jgi:AraC family transcriptional regulator, regulatory protein of adaptative response / methylated-DNA-[protein]-cysteine methyltransferase
MSGAQLGLQAATLETTWGCISIRASARGVWSCDLPRLPVQSSLSGFRVQRVCLPKDANSMLRQAVDYAGAMVAGRAPGACPPWDQSIRDGATKFQCAVWRALQKIPRGRTATYAALARRAGYPRAARAAGSACGANPLPLFVPCHRAVGAGNGLGRFSAGLAWKIHLLAVEGAER